MGEEKKRKQDIWEFDPFDSMDAFLRISPLCTDLFQFAVSTANLYFPLSTADLRFSLSAADLYSF